MAEIVVSAALGVMNPVLAKLNELLDDEGLQEEASFLRSELSGMQALLEKMDNAEELDPPAKQWRKDIIEMTYDIEDHLTDFEHHVGEADDRVGILQKAFQYMKNFIQDRCSTTNQIKHRYRIANQFKKMNNRVAQANERRKRLKLDECFSSSSSPQRIDPRLTAMYKESANLVGIDRQKEEIIRWVMDEGAQLKVVSIQGLGGSGKTTLANEVYREVRGQFNCNAFVCISQKPDITRILSIVLSKFDLHPPSSPYQVEDLIDTIRGYLQDKRYIIVVDDLWDVQEWKIINCAFPPNDKGSRIIVTTRINSVARESCRDHRYLHIMEPLSEADSKRMFFKRIFDSEDACPPQFMVASCEILKKCKGLPLAITTVASILAYQPQTIKEWKRIKDSLVSHSEMEAMMLILNLSYKSLSQPLKTCFLYLGLYPEDWDINKNELIRRWIAEGFVTSSHGTYKWHVAESYFNELVNRSMIQPVYDDYSLEVKSCRVHDMMLEFIIKKCEDNNFITMVRDPYALIQVQDKVRRLWVNLSGIEGDTIMMPTSFASGRLSQVRSLDILGASKLMPPLLQLKFLRVLFLVDTVSTSGDVDLTWITCLPQLRFLKVDVDGAFDPCIVLPNSIRSMQYLEILETPDIFVSCTIPSDLGDLPRLSHLDLPRGTTFPDGFGNLKSLRYLSPYCLYSNSAETTKALGELSNLEYLMLNWPVIERCDAPPEAWTPALSSALEKLGNLKWLYIWSAWESFNGDALSLISPRFRNLEKLDMYTCTFSRVPRWMGDMQNISSLEFGLKMSGTDSWNEDIGIIGRLQSLVNFHLRISTVVMERMVIGGSTGFAALEHLRIDCDDISYLTFSEGAMPRLWKLTLELYMEHWDKATPTGLQHLSHLKEINVMRVNRFGPESDQILELLKNVFQEAADDLPSRPAFVVLGIPWNRPGPYPHDRAIEDVSRPDS